MNSLPAFTCAVATISSSTLDIALERNVVVSQFWSSRNRRWGRRRRRRLRLANPNPADELSGIRHIRIGVEHDPFPGPVVSVIGPADLRAELNVGGIQDQRLVEFLKTERPFQIRRGAFHCHVVLLTARNRRQHATAHIFLFEKFTFSHLRDFRHRPSSFFSVAGVIDAPRRCPPPASVSARARASLPAAPAGGRSPSRARASPLPSSEWLGQSVMSSRPSSQRQVVRQSSQ